jgi:putative DNA primase/helicase
MEDKQFFNDPAHIARGFLQANFVFEPPTSDIVKALEDSSWTLRFRQGSFNRWKGGCYFGISDSEIRCLIINHIHYLNEHIKDDRKAEDYIRLTNQLVTNVLTCLQGMEGVYIPEDCEPNSWTEEKLQAAIDALNLKVFSFRNCLVNIGEDATTATTRPHDPRFFNLTQIPYDFDRDAKCPRWLEFLDDVMEGDLQRIKLLQQWAGYILSTGLNLQKFLLISGDGANGKTVFTTILERMTGLDNVSHIHLHQFGEQFALASTLGKTLNSASESSSRLDEFAETALKSLTSGDRMTFNRKYKEPVHAVPTAKIMLSTNQLPSFADKSQGIWRRMNHVPFNKTILPENQNPHLIDELSQELPGIFNWAIDGLIELQDGCRFIEPDACKKAVEQYRSDVNPARQFLLEHYSANGHIDTLPFTDTQTDNEHSGVGLGIGNGNSGRQNTNASRQMISCRQIYSRYVGWCGDEGHLALNSSNFGKEVKRTFPSVEKTRPYNSGMKDYYYVGIKEI